MKGLRRYIRKHGRHLTDELSKAIGQRWSVADVMDSAQRKVYYNVTAATSGDMAYLANRMYFCNGWSKSKCIDFTLKVIGCYGTGEGFAFRHFLETIASEGKDFDFSAYA